MFCIFINLYNKLYLFCYLFFPSANPAIENIIKHTISTATIVAPTGVELSKAKTSPIEEHITLIIPELTTTALKFLNTLIDDKAGKITSAEISKDPTKFIANTTITAVITAINVLYTPDLIPVAVAKSSSNVTAKILL